MKKQNIWLWALTAAVVLLAAALAETQGQLGELQTAYSALQQEVGELRLDLKSTQNRLQEQEEALERAAAQTAPQPEESLLERYELTPLRLDAAAHQVELGVSLTLTTPDQSAEATLNVYQGGAERKRLAQVDKLPVENYRAGFKMVDTCAAEFSANTPYFYSTYDGDNEAAEFIAEKEAAAAAQGKPKKKKVLVFGSGPIRIGQGIEFDYCSVHCVWTLKKHGCEAILVNNNPETVSTDFDTGDRLYFDPLNPESVDNLSLIHI